MDGSWLIVDWLLGNWLLVIGELVIGIHQKSRSNLTLNDFFNEYFTK
jgi:hypothetical protein